MTRPRTGKPQTGKPQTAIVIGGGIAGPSTAIALQKAGIEPMLFEARQQGGDSDGIMLTLATNGIDALQAMGADASVLELGFGTPGITLRGHTGKRLGANQIGSGRPGRPVSRTMRRADLSAALRAEAISRSVPIEWGKRLVGAEELDGGVRATFADGSTAEADILVGADGVHSTVRSIIDPAAPKPTYSGLITTGGYARVPGIPAADRGYEMIFGKRAFFGYGTAPDGETWWFVNIPRRREPVRGELEAIPESDWRSSFAQLYADDAGPALELIGATSHFPPLTPIHTLARLPRWSRGRMVLLGDAAHAPSPTSGQGASLSIEDAVVLATSLRDTDTATNAFARFESTRRPRVEKIVAAAARINNSKAPGPVGRLFRDLVLPGILRMTADSAANREIYDHHLSW